LGSVNENTIGYMQLKMQEEKKTMQEKEETEKAEREKLK
jgi:hypothetical protein